MSGTEMRETGEQKLLLTGYASVTEKWYPVGRLFEEKISRGAFTRSLNASPPPNVALLQDHAGPLLARTRSPSPDKSPNLRLQETDHGLFVEADLDASLERVRDLRSQIENSGIQWSFSFECASDTWNDDRSKRYVKVVNQNGCDVTITAFGANEHTAGATIQPRMSVSTPEERSAYAESLKGSTERRNCPNFEVPILGESRSKYAAHELGELGAQGMAFKRPDGGWSFPTKTKSDFDEATKMVQLAPAAQQSAIRKYLMARAKAEGWRTPINWSKDGSARSAETIAYAARWEEQDIELKAARAGIRPRRRSTGIAAKIEAHNLRDERELRRLYSLKQR